MSLELYFKTNLTELEFPELVDKFIEEEFDESSFENLSYEAMKDIIPKAGPRNKFWQNYLNKYRRKNGATSLFSEASSSAYHPLSIRNSQPATPSIESGSELNEHTELYQINPGASNIQSTQFLNFSDTSFTTFESIIYPSKVEDYLLTANGEIVKAFYKKNNKLLDRHRNLLVNIIVQKEFEIKKNSFHITSDRFKQLTREIKILFPNEEESVYYIPYNCKTKSLASGKLWLCFNRLKKNLRAATKETSSSVQEEPDKNIADKLKFLAHSYDPQDKILQYWTDTLEYRKNQLRTNINIQNYMNSYAALRGPLGHELLAKDFDLKFPGHTNKLFANWSNINSKLIAYAKQSTPLFAASKNLLENCGGEHTGFFILPYCFNHSYRKGKTNKKRIKLTAEEILKSFILHIPDANLINEQLSKLREELLVRNSRLQPIIVVCGATIDTLTAVYVVIDNILYKTQSILSAVDYCFKSFFSLNASYSGDAENIWTFIQYSGYEVKTDHDHNTLGVSVLMSNLGIPIPTQIGDIQ